MLFLQRSFRFKLLSNFQLFKEIVVSLSCYCMRIRKRNIGITHSLTPLLRKDDNIQAQSPQPVSLQRPSYKQQFEYSPQPTRSRKQRLLEERNTQIQRENRRLYQKLRKIKMKNAYQSESKLQYVLELPAERGFSSVVSKPLTLPQVNTPSSFLNSTQSEINGILSDRKTFVAKYFEDINNLRGKQPKLTEELGVFKVNAWKVKALLLDKQYVVLRGLKKGQQLNKKYLWTKVKPKMTEGLQAWVRLKFQFQE